MPMSAVMSHFKIQASAQMQQTKREKNGLELDKLEPIWAHIKNSLLAWLEALNGNPSKQETLETLHLKVLIAICTEKQRKISLYEFGCARLKERVSVCLCVRGCLKKSMLN